jgi:exosome complex RNA-binding protein Rrp42 (RNase PH superfamily)
MDEIKYPEIQVKLVGNDGNAFSIMGAVMSALKKAGVPQEEIDEYYAESTSGDYDHLLQTAVRWVSCS